MLIDTEGPDSLLLTDVVLFSSAARNSCLSQYMAFSSKGGKEYFIIRLRVGLEYLLSAGANCGLACGLVLVQTRRWIAQNSAFSFSGEQQLRK